MINTKRNSLKKKLGVREGLNFETNTREVTYCNFISNSRPGTRMMYSGFGFKLSVAFGCVELLKILLIELVHILVNIDWYGLGWVTFKIDYISLKFARNIYEFVYPVDYK